MRKRMIQTLVLLALFIALLAVYKTTEAIPDCNIYKDWYVYQTPKDYAKKLVIENWGIDQWKYFDKIIKSESNWRVNKEHYSSGYTDDGVRSTATGLAGFLDSTWETVGCEKTYNEKRQLKCAVRYIESRYQDPYSAFLFHKKNGWY